MVTRRTGREPRTDAAAAAGMALALGAGTLVLAATLAGSRRRHELARVQAYPDSAPPWARRAVAGGHTLTGNAVRINRPRQELYAFWRDFAEPAALHGERPRGGDVRRRPLGVDDRRAGRDERHPQHGGHRGPRGRADRLALASGLGDRGRGPRRVPRRPGRARHRWSRRRSPTGRRGASSGAGSPSSSSASPRSRAAASSGASRC